MYKVTTPNNDLMSELIPFEKEDSVCSLNVASLPNCNACGLSFGNTRPLPLSPARLLPLHIYCYAPAFADTLTRRRPGPEYTRFN